MIKIIEMLNIQLNEASNQSFKFKNTFSQEQIDALAMIAPGTDLSKNRWGDYSLWVLSKANQLVKSKRSAFEDIIARKDLINKDLEAFTLHKREIGTNNIDSFKTFEQLHDAVSRFIQDDGSVVKKTITSKMSNRIRSAYQKMKQPGMDVIYEDDIWLLSCPKDLATNKTMSSIGKWCHTGSEDFWNTYTKYGPLYYILNKQEGYCLCHSYSRQREIRNQIDMQPRHLVDSKEWEFLLGMDGDRQSMYKGVEYDNSEDEWNSFFDFIDPSGKLKKSILDKEDQFENEIITELKAEFKTKTVDVLMKDVIGQTLVVNERNQMIVSRLLKPDLIDEPDQSEFIDNEDGEEFEDAVDEVNAHNEEAMNDFNIITRKVAKDFFSHIKVIKLASDFNPYSYVFQSMEYENELPVFDLADVINIDRLFSNNSFQSIPKMINTDNVRTANRLFFNCQQIKEIDKISFKNCVSAYQMFGNANRLSRVHLIDLPSCTSASEMFECDHFNQRINAIQIDVINIPKVLNPFEVFEIDKHHFNNDISVGRLNVIQSFSLDKIPLVHNPSNAIRNEVFKKIYSTAVQNTIDQNISFDEDQYMIISDQSEFSSLRPLLKLINATHCSFNLQSIQHLDSVIKSITMEFDNWNIKISQEQWQGTPYNTLLSMSEAIQKADDSNHHNKFIIADGQQTYAIRYADIIKKMSVIEAKFPALVIHNSKELEDYAARAYGEKTEDPVSFDDFIDISNVNLGRRGHKEANFITFIEKYVPKDATDIPCLALTDKQFKYRDFYVDERNFDDIDLFYDHPNLAKKYGVNGDKLISNKKIMIVQHEVSESIISFQHFLEMTR